MKIGYLGPEGTFSQLAALQFSKKLKNYKMEQFPSIAELTIAAHQGKIDFAVVPIENSLEGGVNTTLDYLAFDCNLSICGEILLKINQSILSNSEKITKLYSHPQSIGQCGRYIAQNYANAEVVFTQSTAQAAMLAAKEEGAAAIGSESLAGLYNLKVVASEIEDVRTNTTRFVIVSKDCPPIEGADKTSIVFGVSDTPGALYKMLSIFDIFEINMVKIESRPAKTTLGTYVFFVDIDGSATDEKIKKALEIIQYKSTFFKNLGSYKQCNNVLDKNALHFKRGRV
ncbi:MAG: prephenate dehydratase [Firmicutes bacterium]|nr:prephenate dehydratase [Bacillota bacterium]